MSSPKVLILVLAINKNPWKRIEAEGQNSTWIGQCSENQRVFRYIGRNPQGIKWRLLDRVWDWNQKILNLSSGLFSLYSINPLVNKSHFPKSTVDVNKLEIHTNVPDLYSLIGVKTLEAFETCIQEFEFDYIYRTNVSSYIDLPRLNEFIRNQPLTNYYAGVVGEYQGISFASGCGYFISRDLVLKVLKNRDSWDHNLIDDVSLGKLITRKLQLSIEEVPRIDIDSVETLSGKVGRNNLGVFHYRCKAREADTTIKIMNLIHELICNKPAT